jgi:hypothetical protein
LSIDVAKIQTQRKMFVKGPEEVGPFSCQKADLAGSQGSPLGMELCFSLPISSFSPPFILKKKKQKQKLKMHP